MPPPKAVCGIHVYQTSTHQSTVITGPSNRKYGPWMTRQFVGKFTKLLAKYEWHGVCDGLQGWGSVVREWWEI